MNDTLKLNCPVCKCTFLTERRDKIYCSDFCRDSHNRIRTDVAINIERQKQMKNPNFGYDIERNMFFLKAIRNIKQCQD